MKYEISLSFEDIRNKEMPLVIILIILVALSIITENIGTTSLMILTYIFLFLRTTKIIIKQDRRNKK